MVLLGKHGIIILVLGVYIASSDNILEKAGPCDPNRCRLPNCKCAGSEIQGLNKTEIPQFVLLTFDDAVTVNNIDFYRKALFSRKNPNGCPASATFFVSHEYTDYSLIHELHAKGQEIALHSITHQVDTNYWKNASVDVLTREFAGERQIISKFAVIPEEDIRGIRLPFFQMSGNDSFVMMQKNKFLYDCSMPTQTYIDAGLWPYTTDNSTLQDCLIGPCPTAKIPGTWVIPIIDWKDKGGNFCAMLDACVDIPEDKNELVNYMIGEFNRTYLGSRAPFGVYLHAAWFNAHENHFPAYVEFLNYIQKQPNVYLVNGAKLIEWVKSPVKIADIKTAPWGKCQNTYEPKCNPITCQLQKNSKDERWMKSCIQKCPSLYPWLDVPLGEKQ